MPTLELMIKIFLFGFLQRYDSLYEIYTLIFQARLELADYEAENLARLQKMFSRKWEFIFMQAEAQSQVIG